MPQFVPSEEAGFIVRHAKVADAKEIAALANQFGLQSGGTGAVFDSEKVAHDFLVPGSSLDVLVAECQGTVLAYALHYTSYETSQGAKGRYISDIYVVPPARRKGVAFSLIAKIAQLTQEEGGEFVWWLEKNGSAAAGALYAKMANVKQPVTAYASTHEDFTRLAIR